MRYLTPTSRSRRSPGGALVALVAAFMLAVVLAACGSSSGSGNGSASGNSASTASSAAADSSGSGSSGSGSGSTTSGSSDVSQAQSYVSQFQKPPTQIPVTQPLKSAPPKGKTVAYLGTTDPSNVLIAAQVKAVAKILGWNYVFVSYDPANPATFGSAITTALTKHANYLAEAGLPLTSSQIAEVAKAGAKWVLAAVYPEAKSPTILADANDYSNDAKMGKLIADYMVVASHGKANAVMEHVPSYPILDGFSNAFQAEVKKLCSSCQTTLANITLPQLAGGQLGSALVSKLRQDSSANYLVFDDGPFADGITSALNSAGLNGKVKIIGEAVDNAGLAALRAGTNTAWSGYSPGYLALPMFDAMLRNAEGMSINTSEEADTPTQILTKADVGSITSWNYPTNALQQFEKLWHVS